MSTLMSSALRDPWLWGLVALALVIKAPLLVLNEAEYTDGLILLGLFENGCPFYMPLFTLLCRGVGALGVEPILAGRTVSLLAHVATLIPIHLIAVWLTGRRSAGRWAAALYMVSPVPTRWAVRVMTDSLFALWWWTALAAFLSAAPRLERESRESREGLRRGAIILCLLLITAALAALTRQTELIPFMMFITLVWLLALVGFLFTAPRLDRVSRESKERPLGGAVALCLIAGALAALTRQTGWIFLPLGLLGVFALVRRGGRDVVGPVVCFLLWTAPLAWMMHVGAIAGHGGQVGARFTWLASVMMLEAYAVDWPLIVGWPVAILTVWGLVQPIGSGARWRWFVGVMIWCVAGVLALQCLIQSYLFRYLLPLVGFACIVGGGVLARLGEERPRWLLPVAVVTVVWLSLQTVSSLWLQRTAWGDFREAAEVMGALAGPDTRCFANESYATWPEVGTAKAEWWSGREVEPLFTSSDMGIWMNELPAGSFVLLSTAYGGQAAAGQILGELGQRYEVGEMRVFMRHLTPLLPDIMDGRFQPHLGLHQNPLAIRFRRVQQQFMTWLVRIEGPRTTGP